MKLIGSGDGGGGAVKGRWQKEKEKEKRKKKEQEALDATSDPGAIMMLSTALTDIGFSLCAYWLLSSI